MLRSLLALAACSAVVGWRAAPPQYALHAYKARRRRARALPTLYAAAKAEGGGAEVVVKEAARLLRDGHRDDAMIRASKQILELVSPQNNAATLNANAFARSVETHRAHYGPLLTWHAFDVTSCDNSKDGLRCVVRCALAGDTERPLGTAVWTLSQHDERWLIDAVLVQPASEAAALEPVVAAKPPPTTMKEKLQAPVDAPPPEREPVAKPNPLAGAGATSFGALTSPRWVAKTVLSALRTIDEPSPNHGSTVALTFVSQKNPASKLTPELFRKYIDDETYPYGVLTRWVDMEPDQVTFDEEKRKAAHDVTLIDEDGSERLVTIELSKSDDVAPWRIDKFWCEEAY